MTTPINSDDQNPFRATMIRIIDLEDKLRPYDAALDLLASMRMHGSEAYAAIQRAAELIWSELDDMREKLARMLITRHA
jgi:hypothetical protein